MRVLPVFINFTLNGLAILRVIVPSVALITLSLMSFLSNATFFKKSYFIRIVYLGNWFSLYAVFKELIITSPPADMDNSCFQEPFISADDFFLLKILRSHLFSHTVTSIVPSAVFGLTVVFGMFTGVPQMRITTKTMLAFLFYAINLTLTTQ